MAWLPKWLDTGAFSVNSQRFLASNLHFLGEVKLHFFDVVNPVKDVLGLFNINSTELLNIYGLSIGLEQVAFPDLDEQSRLSLILSSDAKDGLYSGIIKRIESEKYFPEMGHLQSRAAYISRWW